ncbi:hypothetical protein P7E02_14865 [Enterococcus hulanensis]|uniref:hypothetical protein n=1 Tax=Enterococcus hulanensis TaxID=2559929 RepID=UPI00289182B1|nr:hypothetical protein [Enterococcus hulanensis]MDT2661154.1 hypothetical protein [Enterococcus hulanensis]
MKNVKRLSFTRNILGVIVIVGLALMTLGAGATASAAQLYRAYNPNTGEHLYTQNANEIPSVVRAGWRNEGTAWEAPNNGANVYRLFNPNFGGDHHYTLNQGEVNMLKSKGWRYEGISWKSGGSTPVYRLYNPNAKSGTHHFTVSTSEHDYLKKVGWRYEGVAFYSGKSNTGGNAGGGNVTPTDPTKPSTTPKRYSVFYEGRETTQYDIPQNKYYFDNETNARNWIDKYADDLHKKGVSSKREGIYDRGY